MPIQFKVLINSNSRCSYSRLRGVIEHLHFSEREVGQTVFSTGVCKYKSIILLTPTCSLIFLSAFVSK